MLSDKRQDAIFVAASLGAFTAIAQADVSHKPHSYCVLSTTKQALEHMKFMGTGGGGH